MPRVRFAPSPTGSLHLGGALSAVANRRFADEHGGSFLLRIDDTDAARNVAGGAEAIVADLEWLGVGWDEGPVRQSERVVAPPRGGATIGEPDGEGALRFGQYDARARRTARRPTSSRSAVDDLDFGITHVIRGCDHRANAELQAALIARARRRAARVHPPRPAPRRGRARSSRSGTARRRSPTCATAASRRRPCARYLEELGLPRHDVHLDLARLRRLSTDAIGALLRRGARGARRRARLGRAGAARRPRPARGARVRASTCSSPSRSPVDAPETLARFRELVEGGARPRDARSCAS